MSLMGDSGQRMREDFYLFPRNLLELDRLDLQHYALREALQGNYLAPVRTPAAILDVGCGTGRWCFELKEEHPEALVVGLDLVPVQKAGTPCVFVQANVLHGLPFADHCFDFVHQRLLTSGVPLRSWPALLSELVRVTRPGGWIEVVEGVFRTEPAGPATARMVELLRQLASAQGLDGTGTIFDHLRAHLQEAGVAVAGERRVELPVGEWGGRVGSFLATDARAMFARMEDVFVARFGLSRAEFRELLGAMQVEWEEYHSCLSVAIAWGHTPG
jgi:SAM-dependent methyltransferase